MTITAAAVVAAVAGIIVVVVVLARGRLRSQRPSSPAVSGGIFPATIHVELHRPPDPQLEAKLASARARVVELEQLLEAARRDVVFERNGGDRRRELIHQALDALTPGHDADRRRLLQDELAALELDA